MKFRPGVFRPSLKSKILKVRFKILFSLEFNRSKAEEKKREEEARRKQEERRIAEEQMREIMRQRMEEDHEFDEEDEEEFPEDSELEEEFPEASEFPENSEFEPPEGEGHSEPKTEEPLAASPTVLAEKIEPAVKTEPAVETEGSSGNIKLENLQIKEEPSTEKMDVEEKCEQVENVKVEPTDETPVETDQTPTEAEEKPEETDNECDQNGLNESEMNGRESGELSENGEIDSLEEQEAPEEPPPRVLAGEDEPVIYNLCSLRKDATRQAAVINQVRRALS